MLQFDIAHPMSMEILISWGLCNTRRDALQQFHWMWLSRFGRDKYTVRSTTCRDPGSNRGPSDLQSDALPTELSRLVPIAKIMSYICRRVSIDLIVGFACKKQPLKQTYLLYKDTLKKKTFKKLCLIKGNPLCRKIVRMGNPL